MIFLKFFFQKVDFEKKISRRQKKSMKNYPVCNELNFKVLASFCSCTSWNVSDLIGNLKGRFSCNMAHLPFFGRSDQFRKYIRIRCNIAIMSRVMRKPVFCIWENKAADQLHSYSAQLISTFDFTTSKFQASDHLLWL